MLSSLTIGKMIYSLMLVCVFVFILAMVIAGLGLTRAIRDARNNSARVAAEIGHEMVRFHAEEHKAGRLTLEEAQSAALTLLKSIRYEGSEYFWVNDSTLPYPTMVMHSVNASLDGKMLDNPSYNVAMGRKRNLFQAMAEICQEDGEGFVDYLWPKPGETVPVAKILM